MKKNKAIGVVVAIALFLGLLINHPRCGRASTRQLQG